MSKNEEPFVQMPNRMYAFETKYYATDDEFLVFYNLGKIVLARNTKLVKTNINLLNELMKLEFTNQSRACARIKDALLGLDRKGYIELSYQGTLKNTSLLEVILPDSLDEVYTSSVKSGSWTYRGYTEVRDSLLVKAENVTHMKVIIFIRWRESIEYAISYAEWEQVLDVSHQTAVKIIKYCHDNGIITKLRGDYYLTAAGEARQKTNRYLTNDKVVEPIDVNKTINTMVKSQNISEKSIESRKHNWFNTDKDSKLQVQDMYIFFTTRCNYLKEHAYKRINAIESVSEGGKALILDLTNKANVKIKDEKMSREKEKTLHLQRMEAEMESYNRPFIYQKRVDNNDEDLSFLLGDD